MKKLALNPKTISKARKARRKTLESLEPSKQRDRLAKRTFGQLENMKKHVSSLPESPRRYWLRKAVDPETNLIRKFKPKPMPKHKKFLKFVTSLL